MLDAIRSLGILKMIEEFEEFDSGALESVDVFKDQRKEAIEKGVYAKLQFEPLGSDNIGIFSIDHNERVRFKEEKVMDNSWKYLFLKTPPNGTYLTPTWKMEISKNKKIVGDAKLKRTVSKFIDDAKIDKSEWLQRVVRIFLEKEIETGELKDNGEIEKKPFLDTVKWAIVTKNIKVFSIKIDNNYNADIKDLLTISLLNKSRVIYQTDKAKSFLSPDVKCSLCNSNEELFPNVLSGVGLNFANVDKQGFFPGVTVDNSIKAFPLCTSCAEALYAAKFHVFHNTSDLRQSISGHQSLMIPHLVSSNDNADGLTIIKEAFKLYRKNLEGIERAENNILKDLSQNKSISTVTFIIGEVSGQSIKNIRKIIPDVLPSRLSKINKAIDEINNINRSYSNEHPWKVLDQQPLEGSLRIIRDVLGMPKYMKPSTGKRAPFKAMHVDSLDILSAIFLEGKYPLKDLISEFSAKLSYDFLGAHSDDAKVYSIRTNMLKMIYFVSFLSKAGVVELENSKNYVSKYLEKHDGLGSLNNFLNIEARGLNTKEKEYTFLLGLLLGKLISIQMAKQVSSSALKWLKGMHLSQQDLMKIFVKTRRKLDDYSVPKSAWSDEMRGVAEAIGALGSDIERWDLSRNEIAFYLCLGQSLSGYYLPSKKKDAVDERRE
jgi:CRISPR-associated Csh1 family protein